MGDPGRYPGREDLTVTGAAGGVSLTPTASQQVNFAVISVETAPARFTVDGTTPTSVLGHLVFPGWRIYLYGDAVRNLLAVRTTTTSAVFVTSYGAMENVPGRPFDILEAPSQSPTGGSIVTPEKKATYRVAFDLAGVIGVAVDISGAASKLVKVLRVMVAKPAVAQTPLIMRRHSANHGAAASTTPTPLPLDVGDGAATAVVTLYTAAPAAGATVGSVFDADVGVGDVLYEVFGDEDGGKPVTLRAATDHLSIVLMANAQINGYIEFTEEAA